MASTDTQDEVLLDLDAIVQTPKYIMYKKVKHEIVEPSVEGYLQILLIKRVELRSNQGVEDEYVQVKQAAALVHNSIPSIPTEELLKLGMAKLMKLTEAIQEASEPIKTEDEDASDPANPNVKSADNPSASSMS